jgi:hypothetical protein
MVSLAQSDAIANPQYWGACLPSSARNSRRPIMAFHLERKKLAVTYPITASHRTSSVPLKIRCQAAMQRKHELVRTKNTKIETTIPPMTVRRMV